MKLHLSSTEGRNAITAYGAGYVEVSRVRYEHSLIVLPDRVLPDWRPDLPPSAESLAVLADLGAEIVLVGTGDKLTFPPARALQPLIAAGIGFEVMDTLAACRTYNILLGEDRRVAAGLIL